MSDPSLKPSYEPWSAVRAAQIIAARQDLEGPLLPILHDFMAIFGSIPDPAVPLIAEALNLTRAEVHGVITFYHDFRREPAGRHVIKLCRAESCQAMGADHLHARLQERLGIGFGQTSLDGRVSLEAIYCLGLCALSPAALVDGEPVARLGEADVEPLLTRIAS